jgi:hypothetical protein
VSRRKVSVELELLVGKANAEADKTAATLRVVKAEVEDLGDKADSTKRDMEELGEGAQAAARGADKLGDQSRQAAVGVRTLDHEINKAKRDLLELRAAFLASGDMSMRRDISRAERELRALERFAKTALPNVPNAVSKGTGVIPAPDIGGMGAAVAAIVGAVALALPPVGAMIGGAVVGAVGTGGVIGGILAASRDPRVKSAARDLGQAMLGEVDKIGAPFVKPTIEALGALERDVAALHLDQLLAPMAAEVGTVEKALVGLVEHSLPGLRDIIAETAPAAKIFEKGMKGIGDGFSAFLTDIANSQGTLLGLAFLFGMVEETLRGLGKTLQFLGDTLSFELDALGRFARAMALVPGPHRKQWGEVADEIDGTRSSLDGTVKEMHRFGEASTLAAGGVGQLDDSLTGAARAAKDLDDAFRGLFGIMMDQDQANLAFKRGMLELQATLRENRGQWRDNTRAGLDNRDALLGMVGAAERVREANIKTGMSIDTANRIYETQVQDIIELGKKAGATQDILDDLARTYLITFQIDFIAASVSGVARSIGKALKGFHFDKGGTVPGPVGAPHLAVVHGGEEVIPYGARAYRGSGQPMELAPLRVEIELVAAGAVARRINIDHAISRGVPKTKIDVAYP